MTHTKKKKYKRNFLPILNFFFEGETLLSLTSNFFSKKKKKQNISKLGRTGTRLDETIERSSTSASTSASFLFFVVFLPVFCPVRLVQRRLRSCCCCCCCHPIFQPEKDAKKKTNWNAQLAPFSGENQAGYVIELIIIALFFLKGRLCCSGGFRRSSLTSINSASIT